MRVKVPNLAEERLEIPVKAHGAIVNVNVSGRLSVSYPRYAAFKPVSPQPFLHMRSPSDCENHDFVALSPKLLQKIAGAGPERVKILGSSPAIIKIEHAIQVDADYRAFITHARSSVIPLAPFGLPPGIRLREA
jgi:hypothetical protein